jgi:tRNA A37 methylthiotransferase MiaB
VFGDPRIQDVLVGVQSGNDRVLRAMRRPYEVREVRRVLVNLRELGCRVGVHLIAGFPTETEEEWNDSLQLVRDAGVGFGFLFGYSDMPGTRSSEMVPKVPNIEERMERARKILEDWRFRVSELFRGKVGFSRPR